VQFSAVNNRNRFWRIAAGERPLRESFDEYLGNMLWPDIHEITNLMPATCP
jgi:hypothetical protein